MDSGNEDEDGVNVGRAFARNEGTKFLLQIPEQEPSEPHSYSSKAGASLE